MDAFYALVDRGLTDPEALAQAAARHTLPAMAVLAVDLSAGRRPGAPPDPLWALAQARGLRRALPPIAEQHGGACLRGDDASVFCAVFSVPSGALLAALDAAPLLAAAGVGAGLGWGPGHGVAGQVFVGEEAGRAARLAAAGAARAGEVLLTPAFQAMLAAVAVPEGVGLHAGNADRAHQVGIHFFEARDYRD